MNEIEKFTCSLTTGDGVEIGSGVIVQIDLKELLQHPSCLEKKSVRNKLSAAQEKCYALITAHSNVYEDGGPKTPELTVIECLTKRKVGLAISDGRNTRTLALDDSCFSCRAVSCCGLDSMLRMPQKPRDDYKEKVEEEEKDKLDKSMQPRKLDYSLRSHGPKRECNIGYDFVVVFLKDELVHPWFQDRSLHTPELSLTQCSQIPSILQEEFMGA